jgi:energy-coupling factor transport system substrate-specific component
MRHTEDCILHAGVRFPPQYASLRFPMHGSGVEQAKARTMAWFKDLRNVPRRAVNGIVALTTLKGDPAELANSRRAMLIPTQRNLGLMLVGALLYGVLAWVTNIFPIATGTGVDIRPGVAVPLFFGFAFGPIVGFVTGMLGNFIGDFSSGYVSFPPDPASGSMLVDFVRSTILNWQIGNGLVGLITGLAALVYHRYLSGRDQLRAFAVTVIAVAAGVAFPSFMDILFYDQVNLGVAVNGYFLPAFKGNVINAVVLMPLLLFNYARFDLRSANWTKSGLLQRIVLAILLSAFLPVALLGMFLTQQTGGTGVQAGHGIELAVKLTFTVVATLALAVCNAAMVALSISKPLIKLTRAAESIEANTFTEDQAVGLRAAQGTDEVSHLSRLFGKMANQVIQREQTLRQEVQQLKVEIDQTKQKREVAAVTDNEYFRALQSRVKELRRGRASRPAGDLAPV